MPERGNLESDRLALVEQLVKTMYSQLVWLVIADVKALPEQCRQSSDDSRLRDVWEEFKDQLQNEQSIYFDAFEHTIQSSCVRRVTEVDADRQCLLWLWSEGYLQQSVDEDEVRLTDLDVGHVAEQVYRQLCDVAVNEPLKHELEDEINSLWPCDWPDRQFVELDNVGDTGEWLQTNLGEPLSVILQNLPDYQEHLSICLRDEYLRSLDEQGLGMPWTFGDHPGDPAWIAKCQACLREEFVAFLRSWRERTAELLEKLKRVSRGGEIMEGGIR